MNGILWKTHIELMAVWLPEYVELLTSLWTISMTKNGNICGILHKILIRIWSWKCKLVKKRNEHESLLTCYITWWKQNRHSSIQSHLCLISLSLTYVFFWPKCFVPKMFLPRWLRSPPTHGTSGDMFAIMLCAVFIISGENMMKANTCRKTNQTAWWAGWGNNRDRIFFESKISGDVFVVVGCWPKPQPRVRRNIAENESIFPPIPALLSRCSQLPVRLLGYVSGMDQLWMLFSESWSTSHFIPQNGSNFDKKRS